MKYSVILEYTHDFEIDVKSFIKWAEENLSLISEQRTDNWISFYKEGELTPPTDASFKSEEHKLIKEHYDSLTEEGEDVKLSLPSRLKDQAAVEWENTKKAEIALITDYSLLTTAQKKLWMGLPLTDEEKDSLGA